MDRMKDRQEIRGKKRGHNEWSSSVARDDRIKKDIDKHKVSHTVKEKKRRKHKHNRESSSDSLSSSEESSSSSSSSSSDSSSSSSSEDEKYKRKHKHKRKHKYMKDRGKKGEERSVISGKKIHRKIKKSKKDKLRDKTRAQRLEFLNSTL